MPKRICFISRYSFANTPYGELYLPALAEAGYDLTVVAPDIEHSTLQQVRPYPAKRINLPAAKQVGTLGAELAMAKALLHARFGGFDLLIVHCQSLSSRAAVYLAGPRGRTRLIYHTYDYYDPVDHPWYTRLERRLVRSADLYMNGEFHRGYMSKRYYRAKTPLIIMPPHLPQWWPLPQPDHEGLAKLGFVREEGDFVLSLNGGYHTLRMADELLEALRSLPPRFKLIMTGRPAQPDAFDQTLKQMGLARRVVRVPRCSYQQLLSYSAAGDAGVLLYRNNDLGNFFQAPGRMTEYLVSGLPLLATNHTGLENLLLKYNFGEPVDSQSPADIARGIQVLERKVREGAYTPDYIRSVFRERFKFELYQPILLDAINRVIRRDPALHQANTPAYPWLPNP